MFFLRVGLLLALVQTPVLANAASLPGQTKAEVAFESTNLSWAGFYAGIHFGEGFESNKIRTDFSAYATGYLDLDSALASSRAGTGQIASRSFIGGFHIGHNWQSDLVVYGLEADVTGFQLGKSRIASGEYLAAGNGVNLFNETKHHFLSTVRARLGVSLDKVLVYGTFGLAVSPFTHNHRFSEYGYDGQVWCGSGGSGNYCDNGGHADSKLRAGFVFGAGSEFKITKEWSLRAEFLHAQFNAVKGTTNFFDTIRRAQIADSPVFHSANAKVDIVRMGVSYGF